MPCKNGGGAPEWARRRLWINHGADPMANTPWYRSPWALEITTVCQKLVSGELGCVEGSRKMAELSEIVLDAAHGDKWVHEDWAAFIYSPSNSEQVLATAMKLLKEANEAEV